MGMDVGASVVDKSMRVSAASCADEIIIVDGGDIDGAVIAVIVIVALCCMAGCAVCMILRCRSGKKFSFDAEVSMELSNVVGKGVASPHKVPDGVMPDTTIEYAQQNSTQMSTEMQA